MQTLEFNISHEKQQKLKEATDYYGLELDDDLYCQIIENYLAKRRKNIATVDNKSLTSKQKEVRKAMSRAYKQVSKQKRKESNGDSGKVIEFPVI